MAIFFILHAPDSLTEPGFQDGLLQNMLSRHLWPVKLFGGAAVEASA